MAKFQLDKYPNMSWSQLDHVGESDDPKEIVRLARGEYHCGFSLVADGKRVDHPFYNSRALEAWLKDYTAKAAA